MKERCTTNKALAEAIGISVQAVGQVLNGDSNVFGLANHFLASEHLRIDARWLATGLGDMDIGPSPGVADELRALGWMVAVHNDYRLRGLPHTFWLFTKEGQAVKGEGRTDREALDQVRAQIQGDLRPAPVTEAVVLPEEVPEHVLENAAIASLGNRGTVAGVAAAWRVIRRHLILRNELRKDVR